MYQQGFLYSVTVILGIDAMSSDLKQRYIATRFCVEKDAWPPEQPKEFTTLALIHHKNQPTQKQIITLARAKGAGEVETIIAATTGNQLLPGKSNEVNDIEELNECLQESKSTHNIADILAPLEDSNEKRARTVLIEGAPGLGKTVLMKQIAFEWAQNNQLVSSQLVFLLLLRDPAVRAMSHITDLVLYFTANSSEACKNYADLISKTNGKNVTFLLDGYDELSPQERESNSFIARIIDHQILPLSAVVVSSRPHVSTKLRSNALCQVDILGFTKDDQLLFFQTELKGQPDKLKDLLRYIDNYPNISSLCYSPFNMTILVWLFKLGIPLPNTSTELYNCFICQTIRHHLAKHKVSIDNITDLDSLPHPYRKIMQQLSVLCLKALETNHLLFSLKDIKQACPEIDTFPGAINGFGLLQAVEHYSQDPRLMGATTKTLNFIHFSVQEYLAAYQITCLPPKSELQFIKNNFFSEFYSNTFAFYVGLSKGQRPRFKKFLSCYGKSKLASLFSIKTSKISTKFAEDVRKCLRLFQCFHEADDQESCMNLTNEMHNTQEIYLQEGIGIECTPLLPSDLHCLTFFLSKSLNKYWKMLHFRKCHIRDAGLRVLHQSLVTSGIKINEINLEFNSLTSQSSETIVGIATTCETRKLNVSYNRFIDGLDLSNNSTLETLYISNNKLSSSGASRLFVTLRSNKKSRLKILHVCNNSIGYKAVHDITQFLMDNNYLKELHLSHNKLYRKSLLTIIHSIESNKTLEKLMIYLRSIECEERKGLEALVNEKRNFQPVFHISETLYSCYTDPITMHS